MATILLSAAGAAIGGSVGGTVMGLSMAAMGRFAGATVGRVIDQRLLGAGSDVVETGRVDRFRLSNSGEGDSIARVFGRMRVGGQVIWATHFAEHVSTSGGGKGGAPAPSTRDFRYTVSLAIALCEGQIDGVGRIWADGSEISPADLTMRVYPGDDQQLPDPKLEAIEGAGAVPAYRGTAYVVFEDLDLSQFGNRVPQFSFEVLRADRVYVDTDQAEPARAVQGVALIPGTGEYALATQPAVVEYAMGSSKTVNANSPSGKTDFLTSMDQLEQELPDCEAVSMVVSWFGDDLRCGACQIRPMVEQSEFDAAAMPWQVSGLTRATADVVPQQGDRAVYGGTPTDQSVIQAVAELAARGKRVMFYPFILMDQLEGNALPDPYGADEQAALPWRGRITAEVAPGLGGSPDGTAATDAQVTAFFGTASASDFTVSEGAVSYAGPNEWSYRRFILHNAALCAAAGGVSAFCIGSEMRGLTQLRGVAGFPAVQALREVAAEVRQLLGTGVKLGYAADWSEYFGYHPQDGSGDVFFHLDPLWADEQIDFIGIDNYMPLTDWRDGDDHLDAGWGTIYDLDYLRAGIEGGEGYDWYYHSAQAEAAQIRTPITDEQEPWIWRYKDIRNWWQNDHHERIAGVRQETPTDWVPQSKPVWFTELGCAAIDKGSNQPNRFLDPKSSESGLPRHSSGRRDEYMQMQYLRAVLGYWGDPVNNPVSVEYQGPMLDMTNAYVWAWDARPYPHFPANTALWSDCANYARGHWLNGRGASRSLASVVREICEDADVTALDTSRLHGLVRGYLADSTDSARALLQPLMLCHGFDAVERYGALVFRNRDGRADAVLEPLTLAVSGDTPHGVEHSRTAESDLHGRVRLRFVEAGGDFETAAEEAVLPDQADHSVSQSEMPILMTRSEGRQAVERWLSEARIGRDSVKLALAPSQSWLGAGDVVAFGKALYRLDRVETGALLQAEGVRVEPETYRPTDLDDEPASVPGFAAPTSVFPLFLDLPLLSGDETPHVPHIAATANPWPGTVSVFSATQDSDYALLQTLGAPAVMGQLVAPLMAAPSGRFDRHGVIQVRLARGTLSGRSEIAMLNGANVAAIGDGTPENWELVQFRDAQLVAQDTWHLSTLLRGQAGSDGLIPVAWSEGSYFVLLDGAAKQLDLPSSIRTVAQHYRIGPSLRAYDDPSYKHEVHAFSGVGLKPYAPAHLSKQEVGGDMAISWIRRTRIDGDSWDAPEVPLGEEAETYLLRVIQGNQVIREETRTVPNWTYSAAQQANDGLSGAYEIAVAQVSARYGPGHFARLPLSA